MLLTILKSVWAKVWPYLAAIGSAFALVFTLWQSGKRAGRQEAERKQDKETIKGMEAAKDARTQIDALDDVAVRDRARQRMRRNR